MQSERNATLMIDVFRSYVAAGKFRLHDFVVMPDHLHVWLTVGDGMTVERAMQFIKGGFSYRLKKECGYWGGLAARLLRDARGRSAEFHEASGLHCGKPRESRTGRFAGGVPLLFHVPGSAKGARG